MDQAEFQGWVYDEDWLTAALRAEALSTAADEEKLRANISANSVICISLGVKFYL